MADHPYKSLPDQAFWNRSVASQPRRRIDPTVEAPFKISQSDRIATAGSCFAQHIARRLQASGFNYLVTESPHPLLGDIGAEFNYGVYTARFGNVYTARQLVQLVERAYGEFQPIDDRWPDTKGRLIDPFRPQIQPDGFASVREYDEDRKRHFAAVREMLETLDVLVFTLGLTEAWRSREDGATYPLCPGVSGGTFDPERHGFVDFSVEEVESDLNRFLARLRQINPKSRVILTVSPVPLIATASDRHVLSATTYSKAVLRVAAERVMRANQNVCYFPSFEIVTGPHARGAYFGEDLRTPTDAAVEHVMSVFFARFADETSRPRKKTAKKAVQKQAADTDADDSAAEAKRAMEVVCEEVALNGSAEKA